MKNKIKLKIDIVKETKTMSRNAFKNMKMKGCVIVSKKDKPVKHKKKFKEDWND